MMRKSVAAVAAIVALSGPAGFAQAGVYTDDLSKCLVKATTEADQLTFMVWMFTALSVHPAVRSFTTVTPAQREASSRKTAALFVRLMTQDCRTESVAALKYEGEPAVGAAFNVFGQVAMRGLIGNPEVAAEMDGLSKYADTSAFEGLAKEAGVAPQTPAKPK